MSTRTCVCVNMSEYTCVCMQMSIVCRCKYVCVHTLESGMFLWASPLGLESQILNHQGFFQISLDLCAGLCSQV